MLYRYFSLSLTSLILVLPKSSLLFMISSSVCSSRCMMTSMVARLRMMRKNLPRSCIGLHLTGTVRRISAEKAVYRGPVLGSSIHIDVLTGSNKRFTFRNGENSENKNAVYKRICGWLKSHL